MIPDLVSQFETFVESQIKVFPQHVNRASSAGHPCTRHLVYCRLNSLERSKINVGTALIFREGNIQEKAVLDGFSEAGIKIQEQQRSFEWRKYQVTGHIDGMLAVDGDTYPIEIKSMNPFTWKKIKGVDDVKNNPAYYVRGYYDQMQLYLLMSEKPEGVIILKDKVSGQLKQIRIELDYAYAELLIQKLEAVNKCVEANIYPDRIEDKSVCGYCDFKHICLPDEAFEAMELDNSEELLELLELRESLMDSAKSYEEVDEQLKEIWRRTKEGTYLVSGKFQVKVKEVRSSLFAVPPEIKQQYKEERTFTRAWVTKL